MTKSSEFHPYFERHAFDIVRRIAAHIGTSNADAIIDEMIDGPWVGPVVRFLLTEITCADCKRVIRLALAA